MPLYPVLAFREKLTAVRTYYVRTDGSDSNNGLANTAGGAFLTIQKGVDTASALDNGGFDVTVQIADGTYTGTVVGKSIVGGGQIVLQGNSVTPTNVIVSTTSANALTFSAVQGVYLLKDFKVQTVTSGWCLVVRTCYVQFSGLDFGAAAGGGLHVLSDNQGTAWGIGSYTISGGAGYHWFCQLGSVIRADGQTLTLSGTPAFSGAFANGSYGALMAVNNMTISGAATGKRYNADGNAVILTSGGGATYLPGNVAGTTASGGQYL